MRSDAGQPSEGCDRFTSEVIKSKRRSVWKHERHLKHMTKKKKAQPQLWTKTHKVYYVDVRSEGKEQSLSSQGPITKQNSRVGVATLHKPPGPFDVTLRDSEVRARFFLPRHKGVIFHSPHENGGP